jgi:hypothetical protein
LKRVRKQGSASEDLSSGEPLQKYLSAFARDDKLPALTTGEEKESFRWVFLIEDY